MVVERLRYSPIVFISSKQPKKKRTKTFCVIYRHTLLLLAAGKKNCIIRLASYTQCCCCLLFVWKRVDPFSSGRKYLGLYWPALFLYPYYTYPKRYCLLRLALQSSSIITEIERERRLCWTRISLSCVYVCNWFRVGFFFFLFFLYAPLLGGVKLFYILRLGYERWDELCRHTTAHHILYNNPVGEFLFYLPTRGRCLRKSQMRHVLQLPHHPYM